MSCKYSESRRRKHKNSSTSSSSGTDEESNNTSSSEDQHYRYRRNERIGGYKVKRHIFDGTFGRVLKVKDRDSRTWAMKVVRRNHVDSAKQEADVLFYLKKKGYNKYFVELEECFHYRGYYCMVFERLGPSLYDLFKVNKSQGLPMPLIRVVSRQLLKSIATLHELKITHTDLKPENILFAKNYKFQKEQTRYLPQDERIKIIDLGGAVFEDEGHDCIINTRQYRAPEVQLQCCLWDNKSDVWGIACIMAEMFTGKLLFQTRKNEFEHVALMEKVAGQQFPYWMAANVEGSLKQFFDKKNKYYIWPQPQTTRESILKVEQQKPISQLITDPYLRDLLQKMLELDPHKRINCQQALEHSFFQQ